MKGIIKTLPDTGRQKPNIPTTTKISNLKVLKINSLYTSFYLFILLKCHSIQMLNSYSFQCWDVYRIFFVKFFVESICLFVLFI